MTKEEYIEIITNSPITEERKKEIINLLTTQEFDFETKEQIADIIKEDIDEGMNEFLTDEDKKAIDKATEEFSVELANIESELKDDMAIVQKETENLNKMIGELDVAVEEDKISQIRAKYQ